MTDDPDRDQAGPDIGLAASKVAGVTAAFWVIKAMTTGFGESTSDFLVHVLPPVVAVALCAVALVRPTSLQQLPGKAL